jgi:hypothetical protein
MIDLLVSVINASQQKSMLTHSVSEGPPIEKVEMTTPTGGDFFIQAVWHSDKDRQYVCGQFTQTCMNSFNDSSLSLAHFSSFLDIRRILFVGPLFAIILRVSLANVYLFSSGPWREFGLVMTFLSMSLCGKDHALKEL